MKTIILFFLLTVLSSGQLIVDSTAVEKRNASEDWFWSRAHYEGTIPALVDYQVGFLWGTDRDNISFAPAGNINHNINNKTFTFRAEMGNLPKEKLYVEGFVKPITTKSKFAIGGAIYRANGKDWYYDVFQEPYMESNLSRRITGDVGATVTFNWNVTGATITYKWYRRTVNVDSTVQYQPDSLGVIIDSSYTYQFSWNNPIRINGQTQASFTTPALNKNWDGMKVFSVATGAIGDAITSRETLLRIRGGRFNYLRAVRQ